MERLSLEDEVKNKVWTDRTTTIREHELELQDSLINPFGHATHTQDYL